MQAHWREKHVELHSCISELDALETTELIIFQGLELFPAAVPFGRLARASGIAEQAKNLKIVQVQRVKYLTHGNSPRESLEVTY